MSDDNTRHLVGVWNPSYGSDVMESHIMLLRDRARQSRTKPEDDEDVYVWWGKIRSSRRQSALPHIDDILSIEGELGETDGDAEREIQLYLTDYRSLYVAHVGEITVEDPREDDDDLHIPPVYRKKEIHCDCWFRLWDIRRLVSDDTLGVVDELKKLRSVAYHDMPVSIYGGMVDLPLIVTRLDGARYFEPDVRNQLTDGRYWVEFDGEHSGIGSTERDLREHSFGEELWARLDPGTRTFIATAEKLYRDHRNDVVFDFSPVLIDFAKAFEVQTNIFLKQAMSGLKPLDRTANLDGRSVDLARADCQNNPSGCGHSGHWQPAETEGMLSARRRQPEASVPQRQVADGRRAKSRKDSFGCEGEFVKLAKVRPGSN